MPTSSEELTLNALAARVRGRLAGSTPNITVNQAAMLVVSSVPPSALAGLILSADGKITPRQVKKKVDFHRYAPESWEQMLREVLEAILYVMVTEDEA